jgi:hypothetical protein
MKLVTLLIIIALIFLFICLYRKKFTEDFVSGRYQISWSAPVNNGGDSKCCGYNWQICQTTDQTCASPIDSGTVAAGSQLVAYTSKVDWNQTYNVMVRANNKYGNGPWSTAKLTTGGGVLNSIVIGQSIDQGGNITIPVSAGSPTVMIWTSITGSPIGLNARATISQNRNGVNISNNTLGMEANSYNGQATLTGSLNGLSILDGDVISVYIYVVKTNMPFTDGSASITVTGSVPGAVSNISLLYQPQGSSSNQPPVLIDCSGDLAYISSLLTGQNGSLAAASSAAGYLLQNPSSQYLSCTDYEKGMYIMWANALPPSDPARTCSTAIAAADSAITSKAQQCGAYKVLQSIYQDYSDGSTCESNPIVAKWATGC